MNEAESVHEVSTQEGYARWASTYDGETSALIVLAEEHASAIMDSLFSFTDALDVGAGTGRYALKLARRGVRVTALDQSPEMLAVARQTGYPSRRITLIC